MYVAEQPYQNGADYRRASLDPGPPPPPTNESDWELHFCRWWGWNWVKKQNHRESIKLYEQSNAAPATQKQRRLENDKEKHTKGGALCWKKKKDHDNLQMMYNTPSNSVIGGSTKKAKPAENIFNNPPVPDNSNLRRSNQSDPPVENLYNVTAGNNGSRRNSPASEVLQVEEMLARQIITPQLYEAPVAKPPIGKKKPRKEESSTSSSCRSSVHKESSTEGSIEYISINCCARCHPQNPLVSKSKYAPTREKSTQPLEPDCKITSTQTKEKKRRRRRIRLICCSCGQYKSCQSEEFEDRPTERRRSKSKEPRSCYLCFSQERVNQCKPEKCCPCNKEVKRNAYTNVDDCSCGRSEDNKKPTVDKSTNHDNACGPRNCCSCELKKPAVPTSNFHPREINTAVNYCECNETNPKLERGNKAQYFVNTCSVPPPLNGYSAPKEHPHLNKRIEQLYAARMPLDTMIYYNKPITKFGVPSQSYSWIHATRSDIWDQFSHLKFSNEFSSPFSGAVYNISPIKVDDAGLKSAELPTPLCVDEQLSSLERIEKEVKMDLKSRILLDAVCDAILDKNKESVGACSSVLLNEFTYPSDITQAEGVIKDIYKSTKCDAVAGESSQAEIDEIIFGGAKHKSCADTTKKTTFDDDPALSFKDYVCTTKRDRPVVSFQEESIPLAPYKRGASSPSTPRPPDTKKVKRKDAVVAEHANVNEIFQKIDEIVLKSRVNNDEIQHVLDAIPKRTFQYFSSWEVSNLATQTAPLRYAEQADSKVVGEATIDNGGIKTKTQSKKKRVNTRPSLIPKRISSSKQHKMWVNK